MGEWKYSSTPS